MLYAFQNLRQGRESKIGITGNASQADESIQLIHGSISLNSRRIFGDGLASGEVGLPGISAARIDAVERYSRLAELCHDPNSSATMKSIDAAFLGRSDLCRDGGRCRERPGGRRNVPDFPGAGV